MEDSVYWKLTLSDGTIITEDGNKSKWLELPSFLKKCRLKIVGMSIVFRSHEEKLPDNAAGYYLSYGVSVTMGDIKSNESYILGYVDKEVPVLCKCRWYKIPELIIEKEVTKLVSDLKGNPALILN